MFSTTCNRPRSSVAAQGLAVLTTGWLIVLALFTGGALAAQPPVGLGTVGSFAVLSGSGVTNTGPSTIGGNVGVNPGTAIGGFPPGIVNGTIHAADAVALQAQADLTVAYDDAAGRTPALAVSGDLGGLTVTAGVRRSGSSLGLTGTLTLDAQGDPNAVFIFQAGSSLTTASGSRVSLINGAQPCNVFWQVGSSATLGTSSVFVGNLLALTSISLNDGVTVQGRTLARNGAVTLINDTITAAGCATGGGTGDGTDGSGGSGGTGGANPDGNGGGGTGGGGAGDGARGDGTAELTTERRSVARKIARVGVTECVQPGFRVVVNGLLIRRVVFSQAGRVLSSVSRSPFTALVGSAGGIRTVTARVTFRDATPPATLRLRYRACAKAVRQVDGGSPSRPPVGTPGLTG